MKTQTETPTVPADFAGAVTDSNRRTVALPVDIARWVGCSPASIRAAIIAGRIRQIGRFADAGDAAMWGKYRRKNQAGCTLVEMMIAIAIIITITTLEFLAIR